MRYRKRNNLPITAVQLDLIFEEFQYSKWGGSQKANPGDWLVNNDGDTYTIANRVFRETYKEVSPGRFIKTVTIEAEQVAAFGFIKTLEGDSSYEPGDYIITNPGGDKYPVSKGKFENMYEPAT